MMKYLLFSFIGILTFTQCAGPKSLEKITSDVIPGNSAPSYLPLNMPVGEIDLPAILVGEQKMPSGSCFGLSADDLPKEVKGFDQLIQQAKQERSFEAGLKAELKKELVKANLEAQFSEFLSTNITTTIIGAKVFMVQPDKVLPDFDNGTCLIADLKYFVDNRIIITGGIKADTFVIETSGELDQGQEVKFNLALEKLNSQLSTSFKRAVSESGSIKLISSNVFFGAITSKLRTINCNSPHRLKLAKGERETIDLCKGFKLTIERSLSFNRKYTIQINKQGMEAINLGPYDINELVLNKYTIGKNRQLSLQITELNSKKQDLSVGITLVGVSGEENFN